MMFNHVSIFRLSSVYYRDQVPHLTFYRVFVMSARHARNDVTTEEPLNEHDQASYDKAAPEVVGNDKDNLDFRDN